jgi:hypothetical protein
MQKSTQALKAVDRQTMKRLFPGFVRSRRSGAIVYEGELQPSKDSSRYSIRVECSYESAPKVFIDRPELHPRAPHLWADQSLCLYHPRLDPWRFGHTIAHRILPLTAHWLLFYEAWCETGIWYGPEAPHDEVAM